MTSNTRPTINDFIDEKNILFREKFVTTYYSAQLKLIGIVWNGLFTKEDYVKVFNRLIEHATKNAVIGLYTDIRKQGVTSIEMRKHFEKVVTPAANRLGIYKTGVVSDASPFKKYYLNTLIATTGRAAKICSNEQDAIDYLLS
jgi:SpoIIAA-like